METLIWRIFIDLTEAEEDELSMMTKMKETVDKQREELRTFKRDMSQKTTELEAVSNWLPVFSFTFSSILIPKRMENSLFIRCK